MEELISSLKERNEELENGLIQANELISKLTGENLRLVSAAAQNSALRKQLESLLSDKNLIKMRAIKQDGMEMESDSLLEKKNAELFEQIQKITAERDTYAQDAAEKKFYEDEIQKKNNEIISLTQQLSVAKHNVEILQIQLKAQSDLQNDKPVESEIEINLLRDEIMQLKDIVHKKAQQIGSIQAENKALNIRNAKLQDQIHQNELMLTVLSSENKMLSGENYDKSIIENHAQHLANKYLNDLYSKINDLETKASQMTTQLTTISSMPISSHKKEDLDEINDLKEQIEEYEEKIRDFEENDYAPKYASAVTRIQELERLLRQYEK